MLRGGRRGRRRGGTVTRRVHADATDSERSIYVRNDGTPDVASVPEVTLVAVCFERSRGAAALLESFFCHYPDGRAVIVDVSIRALDIAVPPAAAGRTKIVRSTRLGNLSEGRRIALRHVDTEFFLLSDDDHYFGDARAIPALLGMVRGGVCDVAAGVVGMCNTQYTKVAHVVHDEDGAVLVDYIKELPLQGQLTGVQFVQNFFLARTRVFIEHDPWRDGMPLAEHIPSMVRLMQAGVTLGWTRDACSGHQTRAAVSSSLYAHFRAREKTYDALQPDAIEGCSSVTLNRGGQTRTIVRGEALKAASSLQLKPVCVWVVTAGRSGSSVLGKVLHTLGVHMGDDLARPRNLEENPDGYYEPSVLTKYIESAKSIGTLPEEVGKHIDRTVQGHRLFGFKLPQTSACLDAVDASVRSRGVDIKYVYAVRAYECTVASLRRASKQHEAAAVRQMDARFRNIEAFLSTKPVGSVFPVSYEDMLRHPTMTVRALCVWLGLSVGEDAIARAAAVVNPSYAHF